MKIPEADVFWDARGWYWVPSGYSICENECNEKLHDAIIDAIRNGYEIRSVRGTRGSVRLKDYRS